MKNQNENSKTKEFETCYENKKTKVLAKYLGLLCPVIREERIIAGKKINSWERDCWPPLTTEGLRGLSGSLGYLDFVQIKLESFKDKKYNFVNFPYLNKNILMISMFGIEPSGCRRLMKTCFGSSDPRKLILESLLNNLGEIALERNIPIIAIQSGSMYNFYPRGEFEGFSLELVKDIYNSSNSKIIFQEFNDNKGNLLEHLLVNEKYSLDLYSKINNSFLK